MRPLQQLPAVILLRIKQFERLAGVLTAEGGRIEVRGDEETAGVAQGLADLLPAQPAGRFRFRDLDPLGAIRPAKGG